MTETSIPKELQELFQSLMPRQPSYRYYSGIHGERYCWTTERINGKFATWIYQSVGKGARSGKPTQWKAIKRINFNRRKTAKTRALARYCKATGKKI